MFSAKIQTLKYLQKPHLVSESTLMPVITGIREMQPNKLSIS